MAELLDTTNLPRLNDDEVSTLRFFISKLVSPGLSPGDLTSGESRFLASIAAPLTRELDRRRVGDIAVGAPAEVDLHDLVDGTVTALVLYFDRVCDVLVPSLAAIFARQIADALGAERRRRLDQGTSVIDPVIK
jgi:hypothetical protein